MFVELLVTKCQFFKSDFAYMSFEISYLFGCYAKTVSDIEKVPITELVDLILTNLKLLQLFP